MRDAARLPKRFCWTRMGIESGEALASILLRKEFERRANGGLFVWGVGNSVMRALCELQARERYPRLVFSRMRSKAKAVDRHPSSVAVWLEAESIQGMPYKMPAYSLVTSRGAGPSGRTKSRHYALICRSDRPLQSSTDLVHSFHSASLINLQSRRSVGPSQVTAVVEDVGLADPSAHLSNQYDADLVCDLEGLGQVRLHAPVMVKQRELAEIEEAVLAEDFLRWKEAVAALKTSLSRSRRPSVPMGRQSTLLPT